MWRSPARWFHRAHGLGDPDLNDYAFRVGPWLLVPLGVARFGVCDRLRVVFDDCGSLQRRPATSLGLADRDDDVRPSGENVANLFAGAAADDAGDASLRVVRHSDRDEVRGAVGPRSAEKADAAFPPEIQLGVGL